MHKYPLALRITAILQLIASFSVFLFLLFDPFMGEHFRLKEELLLIQNIRGDEALIEKAPLHQEKLRRNKARFSQLSPSARVAIDDRAHLLEWKMSASTLSKLGLGFKRVFFETPLILLIWIVLSTLFAIGCLKENVFLMRASWIAPFALLGYGYGIWQTAMPVKSPYPNESELISNHLKQPLRSSLEEQAADLKKAWELYLIEKWGNATPSTDPLVYKSQLENGEFAFNVHLFDFKKNEPKENGSVFLLAMGIGQGMILFLLASKHTRLTRLVS